MSEFESSNEDISFSSAEEMEGLTRQDHEIRYTSPSEQDPDDMPQHKFEMLDNGEVIAGADIDYFSRPVPLYQLTELWSEHSGQGNASKVMDQVESFLRERKKPGILVDAIMEGHPAAGMYEKRGWISVPDSLGLRVYNWPEEVKIKILDGYHYRQTNIIDRDSFF